MLLPSTPISLLGITRLIKVIINTGSINTITTQSNSDITCNIICNRINVTTFRLTFLANYTLNFDNAYADCLNVTLINFKANADCIQYAFNITQITLNISKTSYSIYIANSNTRICTQSNLSAYSNSFDITITQGILNISGAANLIHFAISITQARLYQSSIINSKAFSNTITIQFSIGFNDTVARLYTDYESLCAGTYSITIYCGYSLDFIIGYFKTFSNAIFNFDSYGISIDFSDDNSKTSVSSIAWFILMILLLQILKHFLLLLQLLILRLLVTVFIA